MSAMHNPAHPGEVLREYLPAGLAVSDAAKHLGVTRQALSALLNGRAGMSALMALRLEAAFGTSAEMWLGMQTQWLTMPRATRRNTKRFAWRPACCLPKPMASNLRPLT